MLCSPFGPCLPECFFQLHWEHWVAPCYSSPSAPADSAWGSTQATAASLPAGCSSVKRRAGHHMGLLLGLPAHHPLLLFLHRLHHLNPLTGETIQTWSQEPLGAAGEAQERGRWWRALLVVVMTSSTVGLVHLRSPAEGSHEAKEQVRDDITKTST